MDIDRGVHLNLFRVNFPQLVMSMIAMASSLLSVVAVYYALEARITKIEDNRSVRAVESDKRNAANDARFAVVEAAVGNIPYRVTMLEAQQAATNQRMDRFADLVTNSMDRISKEVNALSTRVEVLSSKIDTLTQEKRAELTPPELR